MASISPPPGTTTIFFYNLTEHVQSVHYHVHSETNIYWLLCLSTAFVFFWKIKGWDIIIVCKTGHFLFTIRLLLFIDLIAEKICPSLHSDIYLRLPLLIAFIILSCNLHVRRARMTHDWHARHTSYLYATTRVSLMANDKGNDNR